MYLCRNSYWRFRDGSPGFLSTQDQCRFEGRGLSSSVSREAQVQLLSAGCDSRPTPGLSFTACLRELARGETMSPITSRRLRQSLSCGGGWLLCLTLVAVLGPEVASAYNHRPENDFCEDAIPVPVGGEVWGTLMRATSTVKYPAQMPCDKPEGWDVWYTFVGTGRVVTIDTCGNYFQGPRPYYWDSRIAVYPEGYCGTSAPVNTCKRSLVETDDTKNDKYGDTADGYCSSVEFRSWPGKTYYIRVFGYDNTWDKFDDFQLRIHDGVRQLRHPSLDASMPRCRVVRTPSGLVIHIPWSFISHAPAPSHVVQRY